MAKKKINPRYIDANLVKEALLGWDEDPTDEDIEYAIDNIPTADVVEVKHGEWIPIVKQDDYLEPPYCDTIKCSECGEEADVSFHDAKYCYMCGAKMDGGKAE